MATLAVSTVHTAAKTKKKSAGAQRAASLPPPEKQRPRKTLLDCVLLTPWKKRKHTSESENQTTAVTTSAPNITGQRILRSASRASLPPVSQNTRLGNRIASRTPQPKETNTTHRMSTASRSTETTKNAEEIVSPTQSRSKATPTPRARPTKRPRLSSKSANTQVPDSPPRGDVPAPKDVVTPEKEAVEEEFDVDFQMMKLDDVISQPWVPVRHDGQPSMYVPPAVHHLISNMKLTLDMEGKARRMAEKMHIAEMHRRIEAENEVNRLQHEQRRWMKADNVRSTSTSVPPSTP